jgi:hypothetical protein
MHRFLTGIETKPDEGPTANRSRNFISKTEIAQVRLSFDFTSFKIINAERPQCFCVSVSYKLTL